MVNSSNHIVLRVRRILESVKDPEIPVLSVMDLGIVRDIAVQGEELVVVITPTYSGCPAFDVIAVQIRMELIAHGFHNVRITQSLSPAWTTDWMSEDGKRKLKEFGIAPPNQVQQICDQKLFAPHEAVQCPHCSSWNTHRLSEFGSTACKSLYRCADCQEPFDYFKCH